MAFCYEAICFDMDSTLIEADWFSLILDAIIDTQISFSMDQFHQAWVIAESEWRSWQQPLSWFPSLMHDRKIGAKWAGRISEVLGADEPVQMKAVDFMYERFIAPQYYTVYQEAYSTLMEIRSIGLKVGIVSNWNWLLPELCAVLGLDRLVHAVVTSARVGALKPHPRIFEEASKTLEVPIDAIIHVGDREDADIKGASAVGMLPVLIDRRRTRPRTEAAFWINNLSQLVTEIIPKLQFGNL